MDHRPPSLPLSTITQTSFQLFTPDEVRRVSVCSVVNMEALDRSKLPIKGGLYDSAMGPLDPLRQPPRNSPVMRTQNMVSHAHVSLSPPPLPPSPSAAAPHAD